MVKRISGLLITLLFTVAPFVHAQQRQQPLTNQAVIKLVRAGFKEKTVIAIIRSRPAQFDLTPDRLIELKRGGVGEHVILAMLAHGGSEVVDDDSFGDEEFFRGSDAPLGTGKGSASNDGGSYDIFGSSSGSKARVKSNGPEGSSEGDTLTSGSATVRILRPPSEAGDSPKLDKTPTLTNSSVVDLVEAGFSEGTIIRRIEQSPAEFDLSPAKLMELRRKRVSDKVIAAMSAAMGDDPPANDSSGKSSHASKATQQK
jgi:hypothetical protein